MSLKLDLPTSEIVEYVRRIYGLDTRHVALIAGRPMPKRPSIRSMVMRARIF
jgi:hypothetical protein